MCNFVQVGNVIADNMRKNGANFYDKFPGQVWLKGHPVAEPGKCIKTGQPLSSHQMNPPDKCTPRFMTDAAYLEIINRLDKSCCAYCGTQLDTDKVASAYNQPRELRFHLCDECFDFISVLAAVVHNDPNALALVNQFPGQPAIAYQPQQTLNEFINMVPNNQRDYVPVKQRKPLPVANKKFYR